MKKKKIKKLKKDLNYWKTKHFKLYRKLYDLVNEPKRIIK